MTPSSGMNRPGTAAPVLANGPVAAPRPAGVPVGTRVVIPDRMRVVRAQVPREVVMTTGEVPLIHPKDPDAKQIQAVLVPHVRVFDLSKPEEVQDLEKVLQNVFLKRAVVSEIKTHFDENKSTFIQYLRWSDIIHVLPGQVDAALAATHGSSGG